MNNLPRQGHHLARLTFVAFLLTFISARILVILIMTREMPDLFFHLGGTHVHHLNYGIFLLSIICGILLFAKLNNTGRSVCALGYGVGLALTFDEFGMWLHLGGSYWQRASFDAVMVILGLLGLLAFAPRWQQIRAYHVASASLLFLAVGVFYYLLFKSLSHADDKLIPRLMKIEERGPE